jgi:hypothetical protein
MRNIPIVLWGTHTLHTVHSTRSIVHTVQRYGYLASPTDARRKETRKTEKERCSKPANKPNRPQDAERHPRTTLQPDETQDAERHTERRNRYASKHATEETVRQDRSQLEVFSLPEEIDCRSVDQLYIRAWMMAPTTWVSLVSPHRFSSRLLSLSLCHVWVRQIRLPPLIQVSDFSSFLFCV